MQDCTMNNYVQCYRCFQCVCVRVYKMFLALGSDMADLVFLSSNTTRDTRISLVWWPCAQPPGSYHRPGVGFISWSVCVCVCQRRCFRQVQCICRRDPNQTCRICKYTLGVFVLVVNLTFSPEAILARAHVKHVNVHSPTVHAYVSGAIVNPSLKRGDRVS